MGSTSPAHSVIPWHWTQHARQHCVHDKWTLHATPIPTRITRNSYRHYRNWPNHTRLWTNGRGYTLQSVSISYGNVPQWSTGLHYHATRKMVQRRLPPLHPPTGRTIQQRRLPKNGKHSSLLHHPIIHKSRRSKDPTSSTQLLRARIQ